MFYTSTRDDGQSDIYRYDIATHETTRLTGEPESEYSATMMPGGRRFSVIRVERDSTQRLWSFALDGSDPRLVLRTIKPVGYQAWLDADHVAVYVLGQPATLQLVDVRTEHADTVARDIDRSLSPMGEGAGGAVSFVEHVRGGPYTLERLWLDNAGRARTETIAQLPDRRGVRGLDGDRDRDHGEREQGVHARAKAVELDDGRRLRHGRACPHQPVGDQPERPLARHGRGRREVGWTSALRALIVGQRPTLTPRKCLSTLRVCRKMPLVAAETRVACRTGEAQDPLRHAP